MDAAIACNLRIPAGVAHLDVGKLPGGSVTKLLEEAIKRASKLSEDKQDHLGAALLAEMEADERWESTLTSSKSLGLLDEWAAEALQDLEEGRTEPLDPEAI